MLGKCFSIICIVSIIFALITGSVPAVSESIITGASKAVEVVISLIGIMALWNGILTVLKDAGIIKRLSSLLRPILRFIFPKSFKKDVATEEITACISANILGVSNAATPLAIKAIEKMQEDSESHIASADMITLAILGCCSFNLVPTTIIAIRSSLGATITYELIVPVWICSGACSLIGVLLALVLGKIYEKN